TTLSLPSSAMPPASSAPLTTFSPSPPSAFAAKPSPPSPPSRVSSSKREMKSNQKAPVWNLPVANSSASSQPAFPPAPPSASPIFSIAFPPAANSSNLNPPNSATSPPSSPTTLSPILLANLFSARPHRKSSTVRLLINLPTASINFSAASLSTSLSKSPLFPRRFAPQLPNLSLTPAKRSPRSPLPASRRARKSSVPIAMAFISSLIAVSCAIASSFTPSTKPIATFFHPPYFPLRCSFLKCPTTKWTSTSIPQKSKSASAARNSFTISRATPSARPS